MQDYIELRVNANPCSEDITDLLAAFLGDIDYESFTPDSDGLTAYIKDSLFDESSVKEVLEEFPIDTLLTYSFQEVKGEDWNQEWEKHYFKPIVIGDKCVVHSSFHKDVPVADYDIVIDPKMAFGTGHHSTTSNMMQHILASDMEGKRVIDMGTGTGILAILCKMRGAGKVTGIEIDPFAWENAVENARLNNTEVEMICGDASSLGGLEPADYFLANINRNIITGDIAAYSKSLKKGGIIYLSGFYKEDMPIVAAAAEKEGLIAKDYLEDMGWVAMKLVKEH